MKAAVYIDALQSGAKIGHVDVMISLTDAGVVDTGLGLVSAAGLGDEVAVEFFLQQRRLAGSSTGVGEYAHFRNPNGYTALFCGIDFWEDAKGVVQSISPSVVQLLVDAGADTTLALRPENQVDGVNNFGTPLAYTNKVLCGKKVLGVDGGAASPAGGGASLAAVGRGGTCRLLVVAQRCRLYCPGCSGYKKTRLVNRSWH